MNTPHHRNQPGLLLLIVLWTVCGRPSPASSVRSVFDPASEAHIPIGMPNTVDTLKTFVDADGSFSPGFGSFGVYVWVRDAASGTLYSANSKDARPEHGFVADGSLVPRITWNAASFAVRTEICQVPRLTPAGRGQIVACRVTIANSSTSRKRASVFVAVRPIGPAGWPIRQLAGRADGTFTIEGHTAVVCTRTPNAVGVASVDCAAELACQGVTPSERTTNADAGTCSGSMRFDWELGPGNSQILDLLCPVLGGRRAVPHSWVPGNKDNLEDAAVLNPVTGGELQPDPAPVFLRSLPVATLFNGAVASWEKQAGTLKLALPDPRWTRALRTINSHIALTMNQGAPDVSVINYTTFNRDGMYNTLVMLQAGMNRLAMEAIDHLYAHPFNGRPYPEADNPGQILWITEQFWNFTRNREWLERMLPKAKQLAQLIEYYRTTPVPHWVDMNSLEFGDQLPTDRRQKLEPGRCDGLNFNYTEAYDVAGIRSAARLCDAAGDQDQSSKWNSLAEGLMAEYDAKFGTNPAKGYGSYCVLWPCRLYPLKEGPAFKQFQLTGAQRPSEWRYFAFATAHQGLLAGNRSAGFGTLDLHLDHPQMRGWCAFDEGPFSGEGAWPKVLTTWKSTRAMPHGWAIAEVALLLRDCLAYEDGDHLVLLGGVPDDWFTSGKIQISGLPTHFGKLGFSYEASGKQGTLTLDGSAKPPAGFTLKFPAGLDARFTVDGRPLTLEPGSQLLLPSRARRLTVNW